MDAGATSDDSGPLYTFDSNLVSYSQRLWLDDVI